MKNLKETPDQDNTKIFNETTHLCSLGGTPVLFSSKWGYANRERLGTAGLDAFSIVFQDNQEKKFLFILMANISTAPGS